MFRPLRPLLLLLPLTMHCSFFFPDNALGPIPEEAEEPPPLPCGDRRPAEYAFIPIEPIHNACSSAWDWTAVIATVENYTMHSASHPCIHASRFNHRRCCTNNLCSSKCNRPIYFLAFTDTLTNHTRIYFNYTISPLEEYNLRVEITNQRPVLFGFLSDSYDMDFGLVIGYDKLDKPIDDPQTHPAPLAPSYRYHVLFPNRSVTFLSYADLVKNRSAHGRRSRAWYRFSAKRDDCHSNYPKIPNPPLRMQK